MNVVVFFEKLVMMEGFVIFSYRFMELFDFELCVLYIILIKLRSKKKKIKSIIEIYIRIFYLVMMVFYRK